MGFTNDAGYQIPENNATVKYARVDECRISKKEKGAYFVIGYYADKDSAIAGLEPISSTGKYYIQPQQFDTVFPNGQPYEANLYGYIAQNFLTDQGWIADESLPADPVTP